MASLGGIISFMQQPRLFYRIGLKGQASAGHAFFNPMATAPSGPAAEGRVYWKTGVGLQQDLGAGFATSPTAGGVIFSKGILASTVDENVFIADRPYKVVDFRAVPTIAGTDASAVTADLKKCTGTQIPSAGTTVLAGTVNLKGTINTVQAPGLSAVAADLLLATGDRLALDVTGVMTAVVAEYQFNLIPR